MKKLLTRNLGLKLASLALAFVWWFLVAQICWSKKEKYMRCWTTVIW